MSWRSSGGVSSGRFTDLPEPAGRAAAELFKKPKTDYTRALFAAAFNLEAAPTDAVAQ